MIMENLDWKNLGFAYRELPYRYEAVYKDGAWSKGGLVTESTVTISEASSALHYGQQCFEGMKAYRTKDDHIQLFRPDMNAKRLNLSSGRLLMPAIDEEMFIDAVKQVVLANEAYVGPYGSGATLYIRPFLFGCGPNIGIGPSPEYIFRVFAMPVGAYYAKGLAPSNYLVTYDYDRVAGLGTGKFKVGGNYASSLLPLKEAKEKGFADVVYLDPTTHTKIEEVGAANFFAITKNNEFITPESPSILDSITRKSLMAIAEQRLGLKVLETDIYIDHLDDIVEAGACGTAAVISPIGALQIKDKEHIFYSKEEVGPITKKLYDELVGIQFGDVQPIEENWIVQVK